MTRVLLLLGRVITHRVTRYIAAWLAVLGLAVHIQHKALHSFDSRDPAPEKRRADGNEGHTSIDFGGQWLMGRMLVRGQGQHLYDRRYLYEAAQEALPIEREAPQQKRHDADELMSAFIDTEVDLEGRAIREPQDRQTRQTMAVPLMAATPFEALTLYAVVQEQHWTAYRLGELQRRHVGGALYPPTQALIFAPLARGEPQRAYQITQWIMLLSGFVGGLGVSVLTRGRIWWPIATGLIALYPGFSGGHELGQNAPLSLAILVWGWALISRGRETCGGFVWGLLAFKPVWAAAFLLVAVMTRRWRTAVAMMATGIAFAAATLPFVGLQSWFDWLAIGNQANRIYDVDGNWIPLSRDLHGIVRRLLIDYDDPHAYFSRDRWYAHVAGWMLWLIVVETTLRLTQLFPDRARAVTGPAAGFILLAGWMSCFRFMYYDALLSGLGFLVLLDPPKKLVQPRLVTLRGPEEVEPPPMDYYRPRLATTYPGTAASTGRTWVASSLLIYVTILLIVIQHSLPFLELKATVTGRLFPPRPVMSAGAPVVDNGKTEMKTPRVEIVTSTQGPAWETIVLFLLWVWCAARFALGHVPDQSIASDATDGNIRVGRNG